MRDIEKRLLDFIALATPANSNTSVCCCNVRAASGPQVQHLAEALAAIPQRGRTFERAALPPQRIVLNPAPWVRRQIVIEGRIGA